VTVPLSLLLSLGLVTACGSDDGGGSDTGGDSTAGTAGTDGTDGTDPENEGADDAADDAADNGGDEDGTLLAATEATLHTSAGDIALTLFPQHAPKTVDNFLGLANGSKEWSGQQGDEPLYQDVIFHRVIEGFMIQGGDPEGTGFGGPGYMFDDEIGQELAFDRPYLLAMANNAPASNTNGSQFFITVAPTPHLTGGHTIFGEVTEPASQAVVDEIAAVETDAGDKPVEDVVLKSVSFEE
jgi:peptidyl-prolyl cis-trans isomerase A (cyclophilin A)